MKQRKAYEHSKGFVPKAVLVKKVKTLESALARLRTKYSNLSSQSVDVPTNQTEEIIND